MKKLLLVFLLSFTFIACSSDDVEPVENPSTVEIVQGEELTIDEGDFVTLSVTGGDSYLWSTGETTATIQVNPLVTTIYSVTVYGRQGEVLAMDEIEVQVINDYYIFAQFDGVELGNNGYVNEGEGIEVNCLTDSPDISKNGDLKSVFSGGVTTETYLLSTKLIHFEFTENFLAIGDTFPYQYKVVSDTEACKLNFQLEIDFFMNGNRLNFSNIEPFDFYNNNTVSEVLLLDEDDENQLYAITGEFKATYNINGENVEMNGQYRMPINVERN